MKYCVLFWKSAKGLLNKTSVLKFPFFCWLFLVLSSESLIAQEFETNRVWFSDRWNISSVEGSPYYRISKFDAKIPAYDSLVTDYYSDTGKIEMTGYYLNGEKVGRFTFYYPDGRIKLTGKYQNNFRAGRWVSYFPTGKVKAIVEHEDDVERVIALNDSLGNSLLGNQKILLTDDFYPFFMHLMGAYPRPPLKKLSMKGKIVDSLRQGKWELSLNGRLFATIKYHRGRVTSIRPGDDLTLVTFIKNHGYPIIGTPHKFTPTELFLKEQGAVIKSNYVTQGLKEFQLTSLPPVAIETRQEFIGYVKRHFIYRTKDKSIVFKISIDVVNGVPRLVKTSPVFPERSMKELNLLLKTITNVKFISSGLFEFDYLLE